MLGGKGEIKYCSILNYLKFIEPELYELIVDSCLTKMLVPKYGVTGITFLRPDKKLLSQLLEHKNSEEVVPMLQSLVLLEYLADVKEFKDRHDNKNDISTYSKIKLPIKSVDKTVNLENDAVISPDKDFMHRSDRTNINVFLLSGALVPTEGASVDITRIGKQVKKGGGELGTLRSDLFNIILRKFCNDKGDPAMELLIALYNWSNEKMIDINNNNPLCNEIKLLNTSIKRKVSGDSLATLAILLRPLSNEKGFYLTDSVLQAFKNDMSTYKNENGSFIDLPIYTMDKEAKDKYEKLCLSDAYDFINNDIVKQSRNLASEMSKPTAVVKLNNFYNNYSPPNQSPNDEYQKCKPLVLFAEAELRMVSAIAFENYRGKYDYTEMKALYDNFTLDCPYFCVKENINVSDVAVYYSTVYAIARSDALYYVPSSKGDDLNNICNDAAFISTNKVVLKILEPKRLASSDLLNSYHTMKW